MGSLPPCGRRAHGRTVARHAGRGAGRRLGAERRAHLPLQTAAALPRGGWVVVAQQPVLHSAELALNACQLLSTKIP